MRILNKFRSTLGSSSVIAVVLIIMLGGLSSSFGADQPLNYEAATVSTAGAADQDYPSGLTPVHPNVIDRGLEKPCGKTYTREIVVNVTVEHGRIMSFGHLMMKTRRDNFELTGRRVDDIVSPGSRQIEFTTQVGRRDTVDTGDMTNIYVGVHFRRAYDYVASIDAYCYQEDKNVA